jgi:hypothetical protein
MKFAFSIEFNLFGSGDKKIHHNAESDAKRREAKVALRGPCIMCGKKITAAFKK